MKMIYQSKTLVLFLFLCGLVFFAGCEEKEKKDKNGKQPGIHKEYKGAAGMLKLDIDKAVSSLDAPVHVSLTAVYPEELSAEFAKKPEKLGKFTVESYKIENAALNAQTKKLSRKLDIILKPFLSGDYELPVLSVTLIGNKDSKYTLNTEPQKIKITSVIPSTEKKPSLRDITPVLDLPESVLYLLIIAGIILIVALVILVIMLLRKNGQEQVVEKPIPPFEKALAELAKLKSSNLLKLGKVKEYYQGMSDILRHYIEERFGIAAPERTTEEFLEYLRSSAVFDAEKKTLLKEFMYHCDLVKFARHEPASNEVDAAFASCRNFVIETKPVEEPVLN